MRPLFGDFLAAVNGHIGAAAGEPCLGAEAAPSMVRELARLTAVMVRCAGAFVPDDRGDSRHLLDAHELAMLDARSALRHAYVCMRAAWGALGGGSDDAQHAAAAYLAAAADGPAAGHDLLQTHFTIDQSGWRHGTSPWSPAIVSPQVGAALINEIGGYAGRLAPWALPLAAPVPEGRLPPRVRTAIGAGCRALPYLRRAVINKSRSVLRHRVIVDRHVPVPGPELPSAGESALVVVERSAVLAALGALPCRQREVVVVRYYADLSEAEVAAAVGISKGAVKSHTARAKQSLQAVLGP